MALPPSQTAYLEAGKLHLAEGNRPHNSGRDELAGLADTIRVMGILIPLLVKPHPRREGHYVIVEGNRRFTAGQMAGLNVFPCTLRRLSPAERQYGTVLTEIVANTQRVPWGPVEFALKLGQLRDGGMSQADIARYTGLSEQTVSYHMELLELDGETLQRIREGKLSPGAGHEAVRAARAAAPPPRPGPTTVPPRRKAGGSHQRKPRPHFDATHPLAADAHALCLKRGHQAWERLNKTACGQCWESAIVQNALAQHRSPAPEAADSIPVPPPAVFAAAS